MTPPATSRRSGAVLHAGLFVSGASALVYESAWGRMLHRVFGVSDLAVATVLAAFFLGMGLGAFLGGRISSRTSRPARTYAMLEVGVAALAVVSVIALPQVHHLYAHLGRGLSFGALSVLRLGLALLFLVPPTALMGATLPVLVAAVADDASRWRVRTTALYAVNTLGAVVGAGLTGFYLLPAIGVRDSVLLAALGSTIAAALVGFGARDLRRPTHEAGPAHEATEAAERDARFDVPLLVGAAAAFATGALSLAGEVLWTRALRLVVQASSQAFAAMLVSYLLGIALGSALTQRARGEGRDALRALGRVQIALSLLTALGMAALPFVPRLLVMIHGQAELVPSSPWVILAVSALLLLPLATVLGTGLPWLVRAVSAGRGQEGAATGVVLGANTVGGLAGSLGAGFLLVPALGLERSLHLVVLAHALIGGIALLVSSDGVPRRIEALALPVLVAGLFLRFQPSIHLPFLLDAWYEPTRAVIEGPTERYEENLVFLREGRNTTVTVVRRDDTLRLFNDGRPESGIAAKEPVFGPELVLLGGLPSLVAERTDRALMIGLGAGHSTTMLLAGPFARVDVVELEPAVVEAARAMHRARHRPFPLDDRRAHLVIDDARAQLVLAEPATYDAILSQPSHPWLAGSSALYTREFFVEARHALRPGGVFAQWVNLFRIDVPRVRQVVATLRSVFPHVSAFVVEDSSFILVASDRPVTLGTRALERITANPRLRTLLAGYHLDTVAELEATQELDSLGSAAFAQGAATLSDDRPSFEYALARLPHGSALEERDLDQAFAHIPWITRETQRALPPSIQASSLLFRLARLEGRRVAAARVARALPMLSLSRDDRALVEGAIAETLGDVRTALARYDASNDEEAAFRADALREVDGLGTEALGAASHRRTVPSDATPLVKAAIAAQSDELLRRALAIVVRAPRRADATLVEFASLRLEGGCPRLLSHRWDEASLPPEALLWLSECAIESGDRAAARRFVDARAYARRALAHTWHDRGKRAADGGNLALAIRFERRALRAWPPHREAIESLADALCALGRCPEAREVLEEGISALRYTPGSEAPLREQAARLGLELRDR